MATKVGSSRSIVFNTSVSFESLLGSRADRLVMTFC
jgi:hypothetical protein